MNDETNPRLTLHRIADALGVPVASLYEHPGSSSRTGDADAMRAAVLQLLLAFTAVRDPEERQRCVAAIRAEASRLNRLLEGHGGE